MRHEDLEEVQLTLDPLLTQTDKEVVYKLCLNQGTLMDIAVNNKISLRRVKQLMRLYSLKLKKKSQLNRKFLNKKRKLTKDVQRVIKSCILRNKGKIITLADL